MKPAPCAPRGATWDRRPRGAGPSRACVWAPWPPSRAARYARPRRRSAQAAPRPSPRCPASTFTASSGPLPSKATSVCASACSVPVTSRSPGSAQRLGGHGGSTTAAWGPRRRWDSGFRIAAASPRRARARTRPAEATDRFRFDVIPDYESRGARREISSCRNRARGAVVGSPLTSGGSQTGSSTRFVRSRPSRGRRRSRDLRGPRS